MAGGDTSPIPFEYDTNLISPEASEKLAALMTGRLSADEHAFFAMIKAGRRSMQENAYLLNAFYTQPIFKNFFTTIHPVAELAPYRLALCLEQAQHEATNVDPYPLICSLAQSWATDRNGMDLEAVNEHYTSSTHSTSEYLQQAQLPRFANRLLTAHGECFLAPRAILTNPQLTAPILNTSTGDSAWSTVMAYGGEPAFLVGEYEDEWGRKIRTETDPSQFAASLLWPIIKTLSILHANNKHAPESLKIFYAVNHNRGHWTALALTITFDADFRARIDGIRHAAGATPIQKQNAVSLTILQHAGYINADLDIQAYIDSGGEALMQNGPLLTLGAGTQLAFKHADSIAPQGGSDYYSSITNALAYLQAASSGHPNTALTAVEVACTGQSGAACGDHAVWNGLTTCIYDTPQAIDTQHLRQVAGQSDAPRQRTDEDALALLGPLSIEAHMMQQREEEMYQALRQSSVTAPPPIAVEPAGPATVPDAPGTPPSPGQAPAPKPFVPSATPKPIDRRAALIKNMQAYIHYDEKKHPRFPGVVSLFWGVLYFLKAALTLNILGLSFRKYLLAKRLISRLSNSPPEQSEAEISNHEGYNSHLEFLKHEKKLTLFRELWTPLTAKRVCGDGRAPEDSKSEFSKHIRLKK